MQSQPQLTASPVTFVHQGYGTQQPRNPRMNFSRKGMKICSILLLAIGSVSISCGVPRLFLFGYWMKYAGAGIWCGGLMIIPGILGILGHKRENKCLIIACMAMSIIATLASVNLFGISTLSVVFDHKPFVYDSQLTQWSIALEIIEIMCSVTTFVVSILLSAICCRATCCCTMKNYQNQPQVVYAPQQVQVPTRTTSAQGAYPMPVGAQVAAIPTGGGATYPYGQPPAYRY